MSIKENIKALREKHKMSQYEFGKIADVSDKAVSAWEAGTRTPRMGAIEKIAKYFGIQKSDIIEDRIPSSLPPYDNIIPIKKKSFPVIGTIAAGTPIDADQNIETYVPEDEDLDADYALRIKGDSMIGDDINDGDIVFIRQQPDVEDGEIAAVYVDGGATLKRVFKIGESVQLRSANSKYKPMNFTAETCDDFRILGKAVKKLSDIK